MRPTNTVPQGSGNTAPRLHRALRVISAFLALFALVLVIIVGISSSYHSTVFARNGDGIEDKATPESGKSTKHESKPTSIAFFESTATPTPTPLVDWQPGGDGKNSTPTEVVNMTPIPEQRFEGWERQALRDLADVNSWPTVVTYDTAGRLKVQNTIYESRWTVRGHIRAFDYGAGASAAFNAEQEDARLSGFQLTSETFYSYRAYQGLVTDSAGTVREARYRWLARTWIFGIDVRAPGPGQPLPDMRLLSEQLLTLAVSRGLPPPPSEVPTPNPTWSLPPNATPTVQGCDVTFSDVTPGYWAYRYITILACDGKITGYADGTFRPENPTTRAQLAKMLALTQGWALVTPRAQSFQDVGPGNAFYSYIETAASHGVISGYGDGTYRPDAFVTRAQVAKMLVLARDWRPFEQNPLTLCDVTPNHWAWYYIQAAFQNGLFAGYGDHCFHPEAQATRAQLAKLLLFASR